MALGLADVEALITRLAVELERLDARTASARGADAHQERLRASYTARIRALRAAYAAVAVRTDRVQGEGGSVAMRVCPRCRGRLLIDCEPGAPPGWSCLLCGRFYRADGLTARDLQPERTPSGWKRAEGTHLVRGADRSSHRLRTASQNLS